MNRLILYWLYFIRFWHVIDIMSYSRSGNQTLLQDSRIALAMIDRDIAMLKMRIALS